MAKSVLTLYLLHVSFYSATNACWDKVGFWVHLIAATFVFFLLPASIVAIVIKDLEKSQETAYGSLFITLGTINFLVIINGLIYIRKGLYDTYQWYKIRHQNKSRIQVIGDESTMS